MKMRVRRSRTLVVSLAAAALILSAAGEAGAITARGSLAAKGASNVFTVDAGSVGYVEVKFLYDMSLAVFAVKVTRPDGRIVLNDHEIWGAENNIIALEGGGTFVVTIYSTNGRGEWTAEYTLDGKKTLPRDVICLWGPETTYYGDNKIWGFLEGNSWTGDFSIESKRDLVELTFVHPGASADFWVKVYAKDFETLLGDYSLNKSPIVPLKGKGMFRISVYSRRGSGDWSATW
jgi:hypothetical protein